MIIHTELSYVRMEDYLIPRPKPPTFFFPCPVCGQSRAVRQTKANKPYVRCDPCGVQLFVRGEEGIRRFADAVRTADNRGPREVLPPVTEARKVSRGRPKKPEDVRQRVAEAVEKVLLDRAPLGPLSVAGNRR